MDGYRVPWQKAQAEYTEKKSRFIGQIFPVSQADEAVRLIRETQKKYWDASHNVYAYILKNGVVRYSDDGEPQGTAGMPALDIFQKERVFDVLCIVTRYFGGTLLGAGGLSRAYAKTARLALDASGTAVMRPFASLRIDCPYPWLDAVRRQYAGFGASETGAEFGADVGLQVTVPAEKHEAFSLRIFDITNGSVKTKWEKEDFLPQKE